MDIQFGQFCSASRIDPSANTASVTALDWPDLVARLAAAHAIRQILAQTAHRATGSGSFAPAAARHLAAASREPDGYPYCGVNQNAKVDGKTRCTISEDCKGKDPSAVRGLL